MKRWLLFLPVVLFGCPQFAPDDVCGYPGFCDGSVADGGDSGKDGGAQCPSGKEPKDDPACVSETLGIFVAPSPTGNDANSGTKSAPVATLKIALQKATSKSFIFVCAGNYAESADVQQTVSIFGGFDCTNWNYATTNIAKFTATKPDYVLHLANANNVVIGDLELDAVDGAANTGQSSVGAFIKDSTNVTVERLVVHAGKGADGPAAVLTPFTTFPAPLDGNSATGADGGVPRVITCPDGQTSTGGKGGDGSGGDGDLGLPGGDGGAKGLGGAQSVPCGSGGDGSNGTNGLNGGGASTYGQLDAMWTAAGGAAAKPGNPGQGGGGGGGRTFNAVSGGGGSGGGGACGGAGGGPSGGGGSSFAVIAVSSVLTISNSVLSAQQGGNGGSGIAGQGGQTPGGAHGNGFSNGCQGGGGGIGGNGGASGGGAGGLSIGILYKGAAPAMDTMTQTAITMTSGGNKGVGGSSGLNDGVAGTAQPTLECKLPLCQ